MRSPVRSVSALGAVFFAAVGIAACGGGIPGNAVVQVNGTPITTTDFEHWMKVAAAGAVGVTGTAPPVPVPPNYTACIAHLRATAPKPAKGQAPPSSAQLKTQCEQQYSTFKASALAFLIQSEWIIGQAKEMNISASNKEVEKTFNSIKKREFTSNAQYQSFLKRSGFTTSDLLLRIKVQSVLARKIQQKVSNEAKKKKVTKAEATKYYNEHKSLYGKPERRNLLVVLTKTEAQAKSAKGEIQSGKSFASVAKAHSIDPVSKAKGGELAEVQKGQQEKALSEAVFAAKKKALSGPIKTPFGYYVFEVTKILPGSQQPLSTVESTIRQQLSAQRQQAKLTAFVKEFRKRWQARTECRPQYMVEFCKGYKAPKAPAAPSTPTTPPPPSTTSSTTSSKKK